MSHFSCVVQEGSAADAGRATLEGRLAAMHSSHYPGEAVTVSWLAVPAGYMFTEGSQSTSSVIVAALRHETTRDQREAYMRGVCDLWTDVTRCTDHEIVVAISRFDPDRGS